MKLFWNSRKEEIRMAESQKNQTEKENIVELKTNIYLLSIIGEMAHGLVQQDEIERLAQTAHESDAL